MGFLERALRRGISEGIGRAVGNAITKAVEPKATEFANKAAGQFDQVSQNTAQSPRTADSFKGAVANLERAAQGYATELSKNMKVCPSCNTGVLADKKFCPECGTKLPEQTLAQEAVCPNCGTQNRIGTKFCQECGTKLPISVRNEQKPADQEEGY